jgi:hypothetical protein
MYTARLVKEEDIFSLINFFKAIYKPGHIMGDVGHLKWQYLNAPGNLLYPNYPNLVLLKDDNIVGHLGMIPYEFLVNGRVIHAAFLASLIVKEELRAHGAGVLLAREAEKYFDVLYTTGFGESAPALKYCAWADTLFMSRWVLEGFSAETNDLPQNISAESDIRLITRFDDEWDISWKTLQKNYHATIDRSSRYLNWRFVDNPKIKYQIFGVKFGYIVLRIEKGDGVTGCRIVDLVGSDEVVEHLLKKALWYAREMKADFIDFFSYPSMYSEVFKKLGFYKYSKAMSESAPPIFILPVDRKLMEFNFSYKSTKEQIKLSPEDWFLVKSDGDRDRAY